MKFILFAAGVVAAQQSDNQCADSKKALDDAWMTYKEAVTQHDKANADLKEASFFNKKYNNAKTLAELKDALARKASITAKYANVKEVIHKA